MNETALFVVAILAVVLVVGIVVFRKGRFKGTVKAPGGGEVMRMIVEARDAGQTV